MAIYTGVADANGDFTVPFSSNYTSGQKITVTAEKDNATKSIELHAPSKVAGGGVIQFTGTPDGFPNNIGGIIIDGITGSIAAYAFYSYTSGANRDFFSRATSLEIKEGVTSIGAYAFDGWLNATSLVLPTGLTVVGERAFRGWVAATSLNIPNTVTSIQAMSFYNWNKLEALVIPSSVTSIGDNAFSNCSKVTSLIIPSSITSIGLQVFSAWTAATYLELPETLTSISDRAFQNWTSCNEVICRALTPPTLHVNGFQSLKSTCIIKVPAASVAAYQAAPNWSDFASRIQAI